MTALSRQETKLRYRRATAMKWISLLKNFLKVTGLILLALGVVLGFADLKGCLNYPERGKFLYWALNSKVGLPVTESSAQAFIKRFPPPTDARPGEITHITKHVMRVENGPVSQASFNYMHGDTSRTSYVATFDEVRSWAGESRYPWIAWILTLLGFLEVLASTILKEK